MIGWVVAVCLSVDPSVQPYPATSIGPGLAARRTRERAGGRGRVEHARGEPCAVAQVLPGPPTQRTEPSCSVPPNRAGRS